MLNIPEEPNTSLLVRYAGVVKTYTINSKWGKIVKIWFFLLLSTTPTKNESSKIEYVCYGSRIERSVHHTISVRFFSIHFWFYPFKIQMPTQLCAVSKSNFFENERIDGKKYKINETKYIRNRKINKWKTCLNVIICE